MLAVLPAHHTKHVPLLRYPFCHSLFHLAQLDNGASNGTALWLGAQLLSWYLADNLKYKATSARRPRVVELGSGIGLSALALSAMGYDVLATDLPAVVSSVLADNISRNVSQLPLGHGTIQVRILDWSVPPEQWSWNDDTAVASPDVRQEAGDAQTMGPPFDLIISSDTIYSPDIISPLFRTVHALTRMSLISSPSSRPPPVYICLERRDPTLINRSLSNAENMWGFTLDRVPHKKLVRAMEKGGVTWDKVDWEGIEIWKLTLTEKVLNARVSDNIQQ